MNTIYFNKNNIVLIDSSYYVFHRYFATYRWFSFQNIDVAVDDIVNNEIFITAFYKHINNDIKKICKKWNTNKDNIVFCVDCQRTDIWRNDIYDTYKATRIQKTNFNKKIFSIFSDYANSLGFKYISQNRLEGDDVIYLTQKMAKTALASKTAIAPADDIKVIIITNDNDFLQLVDTQTLVYNMQFKELMKRGFNNPKVDLLFKAIYGDKSDNISKIGSGITKEKALMLSNMTDEDREKYIKDCGYEDKFRLNMKLISFENIPKEYTEIFNNNTKIIFE
jgi:5'-3' exonuclease